MKKKNLERTVALGQEGIGSFTSDIWAHAEGSRLHEIRQAVSRLMAQPRVS